VLHNIVNKTEVRGEWVKDRNWGNKMKKWSREETFSSN
jgi:hypothetical protein